MKRFILLACAAALSVTSSPFLTADEWPQWRGARRDGRVA